MTNEGASGSHDRMVTAQQTVSVTPTGLVAHGRPGQKHGVEGDDGGLQQA